MYLKFYKFRGVYPEGFGPWEYRYCFGGIPDPYDIKEAESNILGDYYHRIEIEEIESEDDNKKWKEWISKEMQNAENRIKSNTKIFEELKKSYDGPMKSDWFKKQEEYLSKCGFKFYEIISRWVIDFKSGEKLNGTVSVSIISYEKLKIYISESVGEKIY